MATLIGIVSKVIGQVFAVSSDGTRRALVEGDRLFAGDQLNTGAEGAVAVHLQNGQELTLGRGSSQQMTVQMLSDQIPHVDTADTATPSQAQLTDVEQLQKAIAAGDDPTQTAEATAAGPSFTGPGGPQGGGHSFVLLEEVGGRVDPTIGFPTAGFNGIPEFPEERFAANPDNGAPSVDAVVPPVTPVTPVTPVIPVVPETPNNPVTLTGLSVSGGELTVNEANLPTGSSANPSALTQSGTFTVTAPDGLTNLSVGGINVVVGGVSAGFPQSITTPLGSTLTVTGYNASTGVVSYSYTLNGSETHASGDGTNSLSEHFSVVAGDSNGDSATGSLDVNITDDVPKAVDDSNASTASETLLTLNGNVLSNDVQGADRVTVGENSGPITPGTFTGTYGTLVLNANGTYTYTLNTNDADFKALHGGGNGTETFTYTITDADGDSSTANLVLQIHNNDDPVVISGLDVNGGELTVYEKNLSTGSAPDSTALTQNGTFTITALDGVTTLTVGGIAVVTNGVAAGFPQSITTPLGSTLTITGFNAATGVVSYSYTLDHNDAHPTANGANSLSEHFGVTVVDDNGTTANASLDVNIVDDLPKGVDDSNASTASETLLTLSGNVLTNDVQGADRVTVGENSGPITPGTFTGTYGTLVLNANGTYTYTLNTNDADFKALHGGGNGTETFTYTITDADGDSSTANLVLQIHNNDDPVILNGLDVSGGELTVYEKNLSDGTSPDAPALTQSGTFTVTALDGLQTLTVGGIAVVTNGVAAGFPQSVTTPLGSTLTITGYNPVTGVVSYSYTLVEHETHPTGNGANSITENFNVVATDTDGSSASGQINVNIVDDLPKANPDSTSVQEGGTVSGNVLDNDIGGADGPALSGAVVGVRAGSDTSTSAIGGLNSQINGTYGYLTLDAQGNAVYHSNPNSVSGPGAVDVFTYTVRDSDGDESTTTITIDVYNSCLKAVSDNDVTVYEKALDLTKDGNDLAAGTVVGSDPHNTGETASGTLVGSVTGAVGAITYALVGSNVGAYGQIQINANGTYTYTLTSPPSTSPHSNDGPNVTHESFTYQATDSLGNVVTSTIVVNIVDDVPKAVADRDSVQEGGTVSGNVLDNDIGGADGPALGGAVVGVRAGSDTSTSAIGGLNSQINGTYGYLTLDAHGNAVYHSNPNSVSGPGAVDVFTYTVRDSDGDESTTTITIDVYNSCLKAVSDNDVTVYEKALDLTKDGNDLAAGTVVGSDPHNTGETASGTLVGSVTGAVGAITYALVGSNVGAYGQIQINANGTYTYTLTSPPSTSPHSNDGPNVTHESFTYQATDSLGNVVTSTIVVNIVDDVPKAVADRDSVQEGGTVSGNVLDNDIGGADGPALGGAVVGVRAGSDTSTSAIGGLNSQINGTYGYLTLDAHGNAVYHSNPNSVSGPGAVDVFTYTVRDSDGDESTTTITIDVYNSCLKAVSDNDVTVYEKALDLTKDGNDLAAGTVVGSDPHNTGETASGTLVGAVTGAVGAITYALVGSNVGAYGQIQLNANGTYTYTLTSPPSSSPQSNDGPNITHESFTYQATDSLGNVVTSTIVVNIIDDVPKAVADRDSVTEGGTVSGNVLLNDTLGADGAAAGGAVVGVRAGADTTTSAVGGLGTHINGAYGYLTLDAAGNAVYHANPNSVGPEGATDTFTYTIRDSDGDESTTTITIDVNNSCLKAVSDNDVTVYEKALDLTKDGNDLAAGTVTGSDPGNTGETASGTLVGSVTGAVGAITYTLVSSATGAYGQILLNPDGTYTYTLTSAPKTSPGANDGPNTLSDSFTYKATDAAGNSTTSTIVVNIVDDVPQAVASERSVAAVEIDSNVLIVLDISGSMADPSGVPGLSRLDLAKQAISALLDKYDDLGDVKVQLVTFSSNATDRTSVWVDVATAKTLLAGLSAGGGTNYDAAVAMLKTAFMTSGKLDGAQNVGYFFSDGKPTTNQDIGTADETALKAFLDANNIKNYAIGLGSGVSNANLNPLAYDGSSHTDTNAVVVTDLNQLNSVLSGTVVGAPVTGSLLGDGGTFGADGGFIKSITIDGTTYTYDPKGNNNQGTVSASGGANHGTFDFAHNTLSIATNNSGTLQINLSTGDYTYISQKVTSVVITENVGFTVSDNDGDLASSTLTVKVIPNAPPVAVDDHIITNVLSGNIVVPGELLLANDTDPNGDPLTASPTSFNTGWAAKGADFTGSGAISFNGTSNTAANQNLADVRSAFAANTVAMTAVLVVSGYLGAVTNANANDEDLITVKLKQGETLNLDHNLAAGHITLEYSVNGGAFVSIADGGTITASADGTYQIHVTNITNTSGSNTNAAENYQLTMTVNYAGAHDLTPDYHGTYTANDNHGGSDSAAVTISYQEGHTLTGTSGDDVLVAGAGNNILNGGDGNDVLTAGSGNNELHGGAGNDLLYAGPGNDILDGGTGIDTVSYAHATAGVTVDLSLLGAQNTIGAGIDTISNVENLVGSNFDDKLTGDNNNNVINGGLGNDILNGGGGDDLLIGGMGNNTLTGGPGADTFQWLKGNSGHDVVTDFTPGTDKLDLSQLLQGENSTAASLDDYLHFTVTGSGASLVTSINVSAMAGAAPTQTIDLAGVNLASHYGVTPGAGGVIAGGHDTATIINGMLNDHSLKVDTV
ncbi:retention module-containing protein [Pseudomonas vancouverensis]|nr:retention module-containing protein [Pseudomonas vancouverensis]KAB0499813.1 retention module-containing protein [Pseudomonas vancouverensis]SDV12823.1 type I secretion C-terminal target domain (VC_A0849 subclass) [Pseudomonas vancouverensis]